MCCGQSYHILRDGVGEALQEGTTNGLKDALLVSVYICLKKKKYLKKNYVRCLIKDTFESAKLFVDALYNVTLLFKSLW